MIWQTIKIESFIEEIKGWQRDEQIPATCTCTIFDLISAHALISFDLSKILLFRAQDFGGN